MITLQEKKLLYDTPGDHRRIEAQKRAHPARRWPAQAQWRSKTPSGGYSATYRNNKAELTEYLQNLSFATKPALIENTDDRMPYYPATDAQKLIWAACQLRGAGPAYNIVTGFHL